MLKKIELTEKEIRILLKIGEKFQNYWILKINNGIVNFYILECKRTTQFLIEIGMMEIPVTENRYPIEKIFQYNNIRVFLVINCKSFQEERRCSKNYFV